MKHTEFNAIVARRLDLTPKTLDIKGSEYSVEDDRLYDFKMIAQVADVPVGIAWRVLHAKHLVSIYKMFDGQLPKNDAMLDEKCGDQINYAFLGETLLRETDAQRLSD